MFNTILVKLSLSDSEGNVSLTSLAVYAVLAKMMTQPLDLTAAAVLIPVIGNYAHKRYTVAKQVNTEAEATAEQTKQQTSASEDLTTLVEELKSDVSKLKLGSSYKSFK